MTGSIHVYAVMVTMMTDKIYANPAIIHVYCVQGLEILIV